MNRRVLAGALAAPALAAGAMLGAAPAEAQSITGFYCSGSVAVPGTYGTFQSCASFALSSLDYPVSKPYVCRIVNNSGQVLDVYREAWTGGENGVRVNETSFGRVGTGTHDFDCNAALPRWLYRYSHNYVRASVQVSGHTYGTAGANAVSP
jgi:hypothetical protein